MEVTFAESPTDHTQFIRFQPNASDVGLITYVAFRGTVGFDVINFRRNFLFRFCLTTMCAQCAVHEGFWRNFLALRPAFVKDTDGVNDFGVTGMSMGAPLAVMSGVLSSSVGKTIKGTVTFGMPRLGNANFASHCITLLNRGVPSIGFAYNRDPVPHVPPRIFGFRGTQMQLYHTIQYYEIWNIDSSVVNTKIDDYDIGNHIYFDQVYFNTIQYFEGDKEFATSTFSYSLSDHGKYADLEGLIGCGQDYSESFVHVTNAAELFFM